MWVSWFQEINFDSNKKKGRITNKISDGKKRVGEGVFWVFFPPVKKTMLRLYEKFQNQALMYFFVLLLV